ncbi:MAG: Glu/Leu/Phe/Val dehydrogenase family protein, partial [Pirellulales bacterium]|nr:Glu/Leu/Phe/Val dehydrogenase family protein [Pirellulales bacterium]
SGKRVAVLGVGKVGTDLVRRLHENGCSITVADVYPPSIERVRKEYGVEVVEPDEIYDVECDIFSPCSLGGVLNEETIPRLKAQAIVGSANNQLASDDDAYRLQERDILYAPDFVVNAGGLINVNEELRGYTTEKAAVHIDRIYDNTLSVLKASHERGTAPNVTAVDLAMERVERIGNLRLFRRSGDDRN